MKNHWSIVTNALVAVLLFVTPFNLFLKFFEPEAYINGIFSDYLLPKIFLSDIILVLALGSWVLELKSQGRAKKVLARLKKICTQQQKLLSLIVGLLLIFFLRQLLTEKPLSAIYQLIKLLEISLFFSLVLAKRATIFKSKLLFLSLALSLIFQSLLGFYQISHQRALAPYQIFGETQLQQGVSISRLTLGGVIYSLPYGTTSHPNVLGGVLAVYSLLVLNIFRMRTTTNWDKVLGSLALLLSLVAMITTWSLSAWLTLGIGLLCIFSQQSWLRTISKWVWSLFLLIPVCLQLATMHGGQTSPSFVRRAELSAAALQMWFENVGWGVGLNHFTVTLPNVTKSSEIVAFIQPAHHVGLLWLSETGILGLLLPAAFLIWFKRSYPKFKLSIVLWLLVPLVPVLSLDHYLFTTQTGLLLLIWWLGLSTNQTRRL